jgi:glycine betaine catabolism A
MALMTFERRPGQALPRPFYHDLDLYQAELNSIWRQMWLFVGHTCQIPNPGDYFVYTLDTDSVIITRQDDGGVAAFHNVCRHRGSLIVDDSAGHVRSFICPYHQWTYRLDGSLLQCREMPPETNKQALGLKALAVQVLEGLIYICLADAPPDFAVAQSLMGPMVRPQGLEHARIAKVVEYDVQANWKLVWENNRECYHCDVNHPQYIKANFDRYDPDDLNEAIARQIEEATARSEARWAACGLTLTHKEAGLFHFPDAERNIWYSANRTALIDGYVTESLDGQRVAPLMGEYQAEDVGTLRLRTLPNFWSHSSCDHAVTTRLTPAGPRLTKIQVTWLVDAKAQEGRDYELDVLLPFWKLTSEQDWTICERQQRGVDSRAYTPGPLSPSKEYNVESFLTWYTQILSAASNLQPPGSQ